LRVAEPGEFTRRALANGRLDLAQAEGLADLLEAETEMQRRAALVMAEGGLSHTVTEWLDKLSMAAARIEAELDFGDEDDVAAAAPFDLSVVLHPLIAEMTAMLARPSVERLRDGVVVVLAGPRNAGKSSLFNAMLGRPAAIVTDIAGTTRDMLEAVVVREGLPFRLVDTAGLVEETTDPIEAIGIERATALLAVADIILWLGDAEEAPEGAVKIGARADERDFPDDLYDHVLSIYAPETIDSLWGDVADRAAALLGDLSGVTPHLRHRHLIEEAANELKLVDGLDLLLDAEHLRIANVALGAILGRDATEAMLDALFGRFCLGK
jgi:tRNA modification GTPase